MGKSGFFSNKNFTNKTVGFSGIWTWIVRVEDMYTDHYTITTTAQILNNRKFIESNLIPGVKVIEILEYGSYANRYAEIKQSN